MPNLNFSLCTGGGLGAYAPSCFQVPCESCHTAFTTPNPTRMAAIPTQADANDGATGLPKGAVSKTSPVPKAPPAVAPRSKTLQRSVSCAGCFKNNEVIKKLRALVGEQAEELRRLTAENRDLKTQLDASQNSIMKLQKAFNLGSSDEGDTEKKDSHGTEPKQLDSIILAKRLQEEERKERDQVESDRALAVSISEKPLDDVRSARVSRPAPSAPAAPSSWSNPMMTTVSQKVHQANMLTVTEVHRPDGTYEKTSVFDRSKTTEVNASEHRIDHLFGAVKAIEDGKQKPASNYVSRRIKKRVKKRVKN